MENLESILNYLTSQPQQVAPLIDADLSNTLKHVSSMSH